MKAARTSKQMKSSKPSPETRQGKNAPLGVMIAVGPAPQKDHANDEPTEAVEGGKAKRRLDRPTRKAFASGGEVRGPTPSLREASLGIDVHHPAYAAPKDGTPDAPDVAQAKEKLRSAEAWRLSDDEIKAIGDYILSREHGTRPGRKDGGRVSMEGGADPLQVDGSKARSRLDRPNRARFAFGGGAMYPNIPTNPGLPTNPGIKLYPGFASGPQSYGPGGKPRNRSR